MDSKQAARTAAIDANLIFVICRALLALAAVVEKSAESGHDMRAT
jgi:hypothetical protein